MSQSRGVICFSLAALAAVSLLVIGGGSLLGQTGYTKKVEPAARAYYRMKVSLTVDKTEPLEIDLVLACEVYVRTYRDNDRTVYVSREPRIYAVPTKNGHAVQVTTPREPCSTGQTSDNHGAQRPGRHHPITMYGVPPDYFPLVVWYDSKDDLSLGILYASEDAYESPAARIAFHRASIHRATEAEYQAFKRNGPPNLLPPEALVDLRGKSEGLRTREAFQRDPRSMWREQASIYCYGYYRLEANEALATLLRKHMPDGREYWTPAGEAQKEILQFIGAAHEPHSQLSAEARSFHVRPGDVARALYKWRWVAGARQPSAIARRDGGGQVLPLPSALDAKGSYPPIYFPFLRTDGVPWLTKEVIANTPDVNTIKVNISAERAGQLYCFNVRPDVAAKKLRLVVEEEVVSEAFGRHSNSIVYFFQRDRFIFIRVEDLWM